MKLSQKEKAIHDQFCRYGGNAKEWIRKCVLMLPQISEEEIWRKAGCGSIYEYCAKIAGMNRDKVNDGLRIMSKIADKPQLLEVVKIKGINAVRPVATIATKEDQSFWAEKAKTMSKNVLITYVRDFKSQNGVTEKSWTSPGSPQNNGLQEPIKDSKIQVSMKLNPEIAEKLNKLKGKTDWNDLMEKFIVAQEKEEAQFQAELEAEKPQPVHTKSKHIPNPIKRFVKKRANNRCEAPNCNKGGEHLHHTEYFALTHVHDPDKIRYLCQEHHALAHHGLIENEDQKPENWLTRKTQDLRDFKNTINMRVADYRR